VARKARIVLKLGGELLEQPQDVQRIARGIRDLAAQASLTVVHGGGKEIDAALALAGIPKRQVDGLRVTDAPTLDAVVAVLAGSINTRLVAAVREAGGWPVGLTGADAGVAVGHVVGDEIALLDVPTMREYFERGGADESGRRVPFAEAKLLPPIVPKKFFHTAGNFREHEEESKQVDWDHEIAPWIVFFQNVDALVGQDDPVIYPEHMTEELDYELELAVVLRKPGKWFSPEEAADYIGGYVIFNDITARDIQRREMRSGVFSFCKAIDTFCPLGPWIVTPDEIADPHNLKMELRVNGTPRQESHSSRMSVTIPEILSHYSALTYSAGDVLSTGTVSGVAGFSPDAASLYLRPGDVMECEIEGIGVLRNPVISWQEGHGEPAPPRVRW